MSEDFLGQVPHEIEDAGILPLVFAQGLIIHEEVDHLAVAVDGADPAGELLGRQRPLGPVTVGEPEGDVVAERVILQQHLQPAAALRPVDEVRAAEPENMVRTLRNNSVEASHRLDEQAEIVVIDQLCVPKDQGCPAEQPLDDLHVLVDLLDELLPRVQKTQAVIVRLREELHASRIRQGMEGT